MKQANHAFEQRLKELLKDKFKGYKRYGAITGGLTGSTAGGTIGLVDTIKRQNAGEFDEMSSLEKAKAYITGVAGPAAVGLGLGATAGVPGGALLKNHSVNKTLRNMRNKIETDMVADPYFAGKAEGELKDLANRAMAHATVHHEGIDMMKVLKDTLTGKNIKTANAHSLNLEQFVQNLHTKKAAVQEKGKITAMIHDSVKPAGVAMEHTLGKVPNVYGAVENKPLTTSLTNIAPKSPAPVELQSSAVSNPGKGPSVNMNRPALQANKPAAMSRIPKVIRKSANALGKAINPSSAINKPLVNGLIGGSGKTLGLDQPTQSVLPIQQIPPTIPGLAQPKVGYCRSTGIADSDGDEYVNPADVELLNKLGFILDISEYSALEKTGEVLDQYSYIEKIAGVPKAVVKAIDKGEAFSGEFLKDMDYDVPKGYEMKGDLCCPIEKEKTANEQHKLVHYSNDQFEKLRPLTYEELLKNRTSGRWEKEPDKAKKYVEERKNLEDYLRKRLKQKGILHDKNKTFLYATLDGREQYAQPDRIKHEAPLTPEIINQSFFDVVGLPSRTIFGQKGLDSAIRRWDKNKDNLKTKEYMGMTIRPRIEIMTPTEVDTQFAKTAAAPSYDTPYSKPTVENPFPGIIGDATLSAAEWGANKLRSGNVQAVLGKGGAPVSVPSLLAKARMWGNIAKRVPVVGAGAQAAGTYDRYKNDDYLGSAIDGIGALGSAAQVVPHPVAKGVGLGVSIGSGAANAVRDVHRYNNRPVVFRHDPAMLSNPVKENPVQIPQPPQLAKAGAVAAWQRSEGKKPYSEDSCEPVEAKEKTAAGMPKHIWEAMQQKNKPLLDSAIKRSVETKAKNKAARELKRLINIDGSAPAITGAAPWQDMFRFDRSHLFEQLKKTIDPAYVVNKAKYLGR